MKSEHSSASIDRTAIGTASSCSDTARRKSSSTTRRTPQTLDMYVQAAIDANAPSTLKKSRRRRKKQQKPLPSPSILATLEVKPKALPSSAPIKSKRRKRKAKLKNSVLQSREIQPSCTFRVRGLVTAEELDEEDEAEEVLDEIRADFGRFGKLKDVVIGQEERASELVGDVIVTFENAVNAASAFSVYDGNVFGGKMITCVWETQSNVDKNSIMVVGLLIPDELDDPDEVVDIEEELTQIFCKHGEVKELRLSSATGNVTVVFSDERDAEKAMRAMNSSQYGGRNVRAYLDQAIKDTLATGSTVICSLKPETTRVATPIIQPTESAELQDLTGALLKRLDALQERAHAQGKANKLSRRLVHGIHEVRRGLLCNKIILLVVATDLDGCDGVEGKYAELIATATEREVPILAPMNRRKLGRVLQKSVRVSCVGVSSVDGATTLFQQILQKVKATPSR